MKSGYLLKNLNESVSELIPHLKKKIVILGQTKPEDVTPFLKRKIEEIFFRGWLLDELIEIETEIEDIILNDKFGVHSQNTKNQRDYHREYKLRKKGTCENKFEDKTSSLIVISSKCLEDSERKELVSLIQKIEQYRHLFAHKESKYDLEGNSFLYHDCERNIAINLNFIKERLKETSYIKELLTKIKQDQENGNSK